MAPQNDTRAGLLRSDRELFSSLLKYIVQAAPNEDSTDFVLAAIGRNVGADRCYVYRFWKPGESSMCTNTHEWCAEGIKPEITGQQKCNLADLVEFNANITSGRDFLFTDINAIDVGSRDWLAPQGIQSLIATPLVEAGNTIVGFVGFDFVKTPCAEFTGRIIFNIHVAADLLLNCKKLHETYHGLTVALNVAHLKGEVVEFMFHHQNFAEILEFVGSKVCEVTGAQHLVLCTDDGTRTDWFGKDAPDCCHECAKAASQLGKLLPSEFFSDSDTVVIPEGTPKPDMNLPPYCPVQSSVISQFRKDTGWWRLVADYTKPHHHNLAEVGRGLRAALELLAMAYDRERHEKAMAKIQEHQRFRADTLAYALSKDDIPGLIDLTLHRLLELSMCDYIAIHSVEGDHKLLFPKSKMKVCPERCEACSFFKLKIPPVLNADHIIELDDAQNQTIAPLSPDCPAQSLAVVVIFCEGKPWGGIALHYLTKQEKIAEDDRHTLKIAANVLTLALERHSAALRLEAERDRVVAAEKTRSYFFSAVSHDIRTPLNVIVGFSQLLEAGSVSPKEARQYLKMIASSGKTLLQLVNDVLDLSKMDLGKFEFNFEPTDIGELVRELVLVFQPTAETKDQTIVTEIPDLPRLKIDPYRFRQVLFNLLGNAIKYAGPSTIRISVAYEDGLLKLMVADNGRGVSAEKAKSLMQPFVQADIKNRTEGSGLGLSICKRLVELARGTISIETAPGEGFATHAAVPAEIAPTDTKTKTGTASKTDTAQKTPKRILVVDDLSANRAVIKAILKKLGVTEIEEADNGKAALEILAKDSAFDLVMTDLWMPVMGGVEFAKGIKADARLANVKICLITADVETLTTYRAQGFNMLLLKPVTLDKVAELFNDNL